MLDPNRTWEPRTLHFDLSHIGTDRRYTFRVAMEDRPLVAHDPESLSRHREENPLLRVIPDEHLTHYLEDAPLPSDAVALMQVIYETTPEEAGVGDGVPADQPVEALALLGIHVPLEGRDTFRRRRVEKRQGAPGAFVHPKLARLGVTLGDLEVAGDDFIDPEYPTRIETFQDAFEGAVALLFHHPNLVNLNLQEGGFVPTFIIEECITPAVARTNTLPLTIFTLGDAWMKDVPLTQDGKPVVVDGQVVMTREANPQVLAAVNGPLAEAVKLAHQFEELRGQQWTVQPGVTDSDYDAEAEGAEGIANVRDRPRPGPAAPGPFQWTVHNLTTHNGLSVDPAVRFTPRPTVNTWRSTGIWSVEDSEAVGRFTAERVTQLLTGEIYLTVSTPERPGGLIRGRLVPDGPVTPCDNLGVPCDPVRFRAVLDGAQMDPPVNTPARGEATFVLNPPRTGLTWEVTATGLGDSAAGAFTRVVTGTPPRTLRGVDLSNASGFASLRVEATNHWLRHLGAYVSFLDPDGKAMVPEDWNDQLPGFLEGLFEPDDRKRFLRVVSPVSTVYGVPIPADPTVLEIPLPDGTVTVRLMWGGLGRGPYDSAVCPLGIVLTVVVELALPIILLVAGTAITNSRPVQKILEDNEVLFAVASVGGFLVAGGSATFIATSQNPLRAVKDLAVVLGPLLVKPALGGLAVWIATQIGKGVAKRAVPFVNLASAVFDGLVTAAQLSQTIIEVLSSPFVYTTDVSRSIDLSVEVVPDRRFGKFPDFHDRFRVSVVYDTGATSPVYEASLPPTTLSEPITVSFRSVPAGGRLKVFAFFYAENGWQSGQAETPWLAAEGAGGTSTLTIRGLEVINNQVPLGPQSVYRHQQKIGFRDGRHVWIPAVGDPPKATRSSPPPKPGNRVIQLQGITLAQAPAMVGYSWQATGLDQPRDRVNAPPTNAALFTVQNLSILEDPETGYSIPKVGFSQMSGVFYDLASPNDGQGLDFFIDPSRGPFDPETNPAGGFHLRRVALTRGGRPDFDTLSERSWGRFPEPLDRFVLHPQGYVFGITFRNSKIYRLELPPAEMSDGTSPMAVLSSGEGFREGLINGPRGLAVALDGRLLILEALNNRIQAFDVFGNPVPFFRDPAGGREKVPTLPLVSPRGTNYLDLAVESQGFLYVLGFSGDGSKPADYRVDLYRPDGTFLATTPSVTAAKIAVSLLRNLFTLNYETLLGASGRTEPSVSMWLPPPPGPRAEDVDEEAGAEGAGAGDAGGGGDAG